MRDNSLSKYGTTCVSAGLGWVAAVCEGISRPENEFAQQHDDNIMVKGLLAYMCTASVPCGDDMMWPVVTSWPVEVEAPDSLGCEANRKSAWVAPRDAVESQIEVGMSQTE